MYLHELKKKKKVLYDFLIIYWVGKGLNDFTF